MLVEDVPCQKAVLCAEQTNFVTVSAYMFVAFQSRSVPRPAVALDGEPHACLGGASKVRRVRLPCAFLSWKPTQSLREP